MNTYVFRNTLTGEIRQAVAQALNHAARECGIDVPYRGTLPEPWRAVECRAANGAVLWTDDGAPPA